jgi:hypothetical protein
VSVSEESGEVFDSDAERQVLQEWDMVKIESYRPVTPEEMERFLVYLADRIERGPKVIANLYEKVHTAEERYQHEFSDAVVNGPYSAIGYARQYAHLQTAEAQRDLNTAKEALRYAEELLKALITKSMIMSNVNKSLMTQFMGTARRY